MGKFFKTAEAAKTKVKSVVRVKPLSVSSDSIKLKNIPVDTGTIKPKINIMPIVPKKKNVINITKPKDGTLSAHSLNLLTNQRLDFRNKNKTTRFTLGKLRKKNMMGDTQYGISWQKKF